MKSRSSASLFLLCALIINNFTDSSACDFTVAVGSPVTIKLGLDQTDELVWKHNSKRVVKGEVKTLPTKLKNAKVTSDDLVISSVKKEDNGDHEFEVFLSNGTSKAKKTITLCVHEKPPKPTVNDTCIDGTPYITCEVKDKTGRTFSWYKNGKRIDGNSASLKNIERDQDYECAVEQPIPSEKSNKFILTATKCKSSENGEEGDMLWGFERWIMITILAGGGSLVLVLMIVLVICACQSCKRREKHLQDEEEFKLHHFHTSPHSGQQRSKNTARGQPAPPVPQEDPEVSNYEVDEPPPKTQPRSKRSPRPPPPPVDDDEQPPPLPQPRKNGPHGKKNQGPLYMQQ
ncbi:T-cell surface antigen CD2 isoform X2 [Astyanax mexicanus]|uniref:T-cell surface antigen CD2 isoform X2 n=1 Tax=Astyanax mexicanus TaxID=7994 RepID=UPI0020CB3D3C|nr:T-cell surface antigen CD2 isoform X2 [Astyanax mexicanus]